MDASKGQKWVSPDTWNSGETGVFQRQVRIQFGRPSQYCKNFGICRMEPAVPDGNAFTGSAGHACKARCSKVLLVWSRHWLSFRFPKRLLIPEVEARFFGTSYFKIEEDFQFPEGLFSLPFQSGRCRILKANYPLVENQWSYELNMRISKSENLFVCEPQLTLKN